MARKLKDIELQEVSLVDKAANKKKFLFTKQKKKEISVTIESDGTAAGSKVTINGDELGKLRDFNFSFYRGDLSGSTVTPVSCSYSKIVESEDGFSRSETFYLSKGDFTMDKELMKSLKKYFGDDAEVDFEKAGKPGDENIELLQKALGTILEYKNEFPADLSEAVGNLMLAGCAKTVHVEKKKEEEEDETIEKAGAKFSKEVLAKLRSIVAAAKALESILPQAEKKSDDDNADVKKQVEDLKRKMDSLVQKKDEKADGDEKSELKKMIEEVKATIDVIAKSTGVKKGIDGQDDDDGNESSKDLKWRSLSG